MLTGGGQQGWLIFVAASSGEKHATTKPSDFEDLLTFASEECVGA